MQLACVLRASYLWVKSPYIAEQLKIITARPCGFSISTACKEAVLDAIFFTVLITVRSMAVGGLAIRSS
jgi:hypothetical protein